jgi:hypothetical protein
MNPTIKFENLITSLFIVCFTIAVTCLIMAMYDVPQSVIWDLIVNMTGILCLLLSVILFFIISSSELFNKAHHIILIPLYVVSSLAITVWYLYVFLNHLPFYTSISEWVLIGAMILHAIVVVIIASINLEISHSNTMKVPKKF